MYIALNDGGLSNTNVSDHQNLVEELAVLVVTSNSVILRFQASVSFMYLRSCQNGFIN